MSHQNQCHRVHGQELIFFFHDRSLESGDFYINGVSKFLVFPSVSYLLTESPSSGVR